MSFGSISMLAWGLAIAVPVILHLLRKRKSRTIAWGAMRFLEAAMVRRAKRFQLWRLLLLLLRIAAIALLAMAVARPLLKGEADATGGATGDVGVLNVFVFDSSYSMQSVGGSENGPRTSRFDAAKQAAAIVLDECDAGDGFLVMKLLADAEWIGSGISFRLDEIRSLIAELQPEQGTANLTNGLLSVERVLDEVKEDGWLGPIQVYIFSDLQPLTWDRPSVGEVIDRIVGSDAQAKTQVMVVDCRESETVTNIFAEDLSIKRSGADQRSTFEARAGATKSRPNSDDIEDSALAQLIVNGRVEQSRRVELREASRVLDWNRRLPAGRHVVEVRLAADDAISLDNNVRQVVTIRDKISVGLFSSSAESSRFLELALSAGSVANGSEGGASFTVRQYRLNEMPNAELGNDSLWILCDPAPLDSRSAQRLEQYVRQGGAVVWWLGPNWRPESGGLRMDKKGDDDWRAIQVVGSQEMESPLKIDPLGYKDSIVEPFEPYPGAGLITLPIFRYWHLKLAPAWSVTLAVTGGEVEEGMSPLVAKLDRDSGGREVIIATPPSPGTRAGLGVDAGTADEPWNALIAWPAFVPLVQEILHWASAGQEVPGAFLVGQPIVGSSPEKEVGSRLSGSSGEQLTVEVIERFGTKVRWSAGIAKRADLYRWADGPSQGEAVFVVNVDPREGLLGGETTVRAPMTLLDSDQIGSTMLAVSDSTIGTNASDIETNNTDRDRSTAFGESDFGWLLLLASIGLLLGESVLVRMLENRF